MPKVDYNKEYETAYDVSKLAEKPAAGKASIEAFFTAKGNDVFAILPRWPGRTFHPEGRGCLAREVGEPARLRRPASLHGQGRERDDRAVPDLPDRAFLRQPAWALKLGQ